MDLYEKLLVLVHIVVRLFSLIFFRSLSYVKLIGQQFVFSGSDCVVGVLVSSPLIFFLETQYKYRYLYTYEHSP
jgi:hypothetical protein